MSTTHIHGTTHEPDCYYTDDSVLPFGLIFVTMEKGPSYDYRAQAWREFHDHYHTAPLEAGAPDKAYCGADIATCQRLPR